MFGQRQHHSCEHDSLSRGLGWVSIALGVGGIFAPRQIAKLLGVEGEVAAGITRVVGVRELCHGIDLLSHRDPTPGIWSRVAGDVLDGVLLGIAAKKTTNPTGFVGATAPVMGVVAADLIEAAKLSGQKLLS